MSDSQARRRRWVEGPLPRALRASLVIFMTAWCLLLVAPLRTAAPQGGAIFQGSGTELQKALADPQRYGRIQISEDKFYFPRFLPTDPPSSISLVDAENNGLSKILIAMDEPPIFKDQRQSLETYRFLWLRTFHEPIAVRLQKLNEEITLAVKVLDGKGGYYPGRLKISEQKAMDVSAWQEFKNRLVRAGFWKMGWQDNRKIILDGASWILEGRDGDRYHFVERGSPRNGDAFRVTCLYLIEVAGLRQRDPKLAIY